MSELESIAIVRITVAALLGAMLGIEREVTHHPAGLRTHILVSIAAAALAACAFIASTEMSAILKSDPGRIMQGVVAGMGFIGAGAIIREGTSIHGITTAASLWTATAIGLLCGVGAYHLAVFTALLSTLTLVLSGPLLRRNADRNGKNQ